MEETLTPIDDTTACPYCSEAIKSVAIKCRFCGELIGDRAFPGVFRQGPLLVINRRANFPPRCVRSNDEARHWLRRKVTWHPMLIYALLLLGPLPYIIGAVVSRKQARVEIPLSEETFRRRRRLLLLAWMVALAGVGLFVAGLTQVNTNNPTLVGWLMSAGGIAFFLGIAFGLATSPPLNVTKIAGNYAWFKGAHPAYLDPLPDWPGNL